MSDTGPSWESLPLSTRTTQQIVDGLVDLVIDTRKATDLTRETVGRAFKLELQELRSGHPGSYARLTSTRSYAFGLHGAGTDRVYLHLTFFSKDGDAASDEPAPELRLDRFAERLKQAGFQQQTRYGEHGRRLGDEFVRDGLKLQVIVTGHRVDDGPLLKTIQSVVVS
ncbi:hypothetical protein [Microlunatus soli]|uniref:Uncharacterized protein n=1 Tax=Microlunatus soli TaxID=630515 RepID=A0A1H1TZK8_9ACTN|nr:hypothetical protein [Microlunatus soli]SDS65668.1 hypothetical protein SAMN04489812_2582 [Microlunatus soli]